MTAELNWNVRLKHPPLPVGLIGCGEVARRYAAALGPHTHAGLRLTCVTDVEGAAGAAFAAEFCLRSLPSVKSLLAEQVALVCICTPSATHAPLARQCLESGKHIILEHPMAMNSRDARDLLETAERARRQLFIVRQRRFLHAIQLLRAGLREGLLGDIREVRLSVCWNRRPAYFTERPWRAQAQSGGVVLNQASHFLDLLLYLFGEPLAVEGALGNIAHDLPCEDSAVGSILFAGGFRALIECTTGAPPGRNWARLLVRGTRQQLQLCGRACESFAGPVPPEITRLGESLRPPLTGDHAGFLERVGRRLAGDGVEVVDAREGVRAVHLIDDIYASFVRDDAGLRAHFARVFSDPCAAAGTTAEARAGDFS